MDIAHPPYSRLVKGLGMLGLWAAIGLILSIEVYFNVRVTKPDVSFMEVAGGQYARALLWACLAPIVLWLRTKVPLRLGYWVGGVAFHAILSFLIMAGYYLFRVGYLLLAEGEPLTDFWATAFDNFFGRNLIDMVFYWGVFGCGYSFELYRKYKNEQVKAAQLESRLIETELKVLRQQMHPHFLFNTMNTIAVLVRERRNEEAVNLIARFSTLLRMSLEGARVHEVTLRQEMDFLARYVEIQQARFADRLTVRTTISPEAMEARIPNLLLQPIVENAILHGIAPKNSPGTVEVTGEVRAGRLHLTVSDDGPGFVPAAPGRGREGIGLANTRERLSKLYGARSELRLESEQGKGTTVTIVLPCPA